MENHAILVGCLFIILAWLCKVEDGGYVWRGWPAPWFTGIMFYSIGILFIVYGFVKKRRDNEYLICPKCMKTFFNKKKSNCECPNCKVEMENLKGFYKKHPDLKKQPKNTGKTGKTEDR